MRGRGKQVVRRGIGVNKLLVQRGTNRMLVEEEGQTGC